MFDHHLDNLHGQFGADGRISSHNATSMKAKEAKLELLTLGLYAKKIQKIHLLKIYEDLIVPRFYVVVAAMLGH